MYKISKFCFSSVFSASGGSMPKYSGKNLIILDLNCFLGYRQFTKILIDETKHISGIKYHLVEGEYTTIFRPNFELLMELLFEKKRPYLDVGVWSNQSKAETEIQVNQFFRSLKLNLKFIFYSANTNPTFDRYSKYVQGKEASQLIPHDVSKDLSLVFNKYPQYNSKNTLMFSSSRNLCTKYKDNEVLIPQYRPNGEVNLIRDATLYHVYEYILFMNSLYQGYNGNVFFC